MSNGNEGVPHAPQNFKTGALSSYAIQCHIQDTPFLEKGLNSLLEIAECKNDCSVLAKCHSIIYVRVYIYIYMSVYFFY